jgi:membrane protein
MKKGLLKKVTAIVREDFSLHRLSTEGQSTLSLLERFVHFWFFAGKSFIRNRCMVRASALAFSNLIALVPMLAIAISVSASILKEDKDQKKIDEFITWVVGIMVPENKPVGKAAKVDGVTKEPGAVESVPPAEIGKQVDTEADAALAEDFHAAVKERISEFVANIRGGALSTGSMIFLIVVVILMLARIEDTFNDIWGVKKGRNWFARITTYWAAMTLGPVLLMAAMTINSGQQMAAVINWMANLSTPWNQIFGFFTKLMPFFLLSLGFTIFYKLMPNTKVQWRAAFVGGICGGTLWQLNNLAVVFYFSRVATNNKIYGALGMIPVIMASLYFGWLFLLFGAQFAYAFQNRRAYVQDRLVESLTPRGREVQALRIMAEVGRRFFNGEGPTSADQLAERLGVPSRLIVSIVETLMDDHLVFEINEEDRSYLPARPLWTITFADIIEAVRNGTSANAVKPAASGGDRVGDEYEQVIQREMRAAGKTTLEKIAEELGELTPPERTGEGNGKPIGTAPDADSDLALPPERR